MDCDALNKMGLTLCAEKKYHEGVKCFRQALAVNPKFFEARYNLGISYHRLQRYPEAILEYQLLLRYLPSHHALHNKLGNALQQLGKYAEAINHFQKAVALSPTKPEYIYNLANTLKQFGNIKVAEKAYLKAIQLKPDYLKAIHNLGTMYFEKQQYDQAIQQFENLLIYQPDSLTALSNLGEIWQQRKDYQKAITYLQRAMALDPENIALVDSYAFTMKMDCRWHELDKWLARLIELSRQKIGKISEQNISPFHSLSLDISAKERAEIAKHHADFITAGVPVVKRAFKTTSAKKRLRVAYFSGNFYDHPSLHLISGVLEQHSKENIELFAYSLGPNDKSHYRVRVEKACEHFIDIQHEPIEDTVNRILKDQIDVAIDLTCYTNFGRPKLFAQRIAPVQINYLGFPGTSGSTWLDYYIADTTVLPEEKAQFFSEKIIYLPHTYFPTDNRLAIASEGPSRRECKLPEKAFVYCCFCTNYKLEPIMFGAWMEILRRVPKSVLWLYTDRIEVENNLRQEAEQAGIHGERLIFAHRETKERHLHRHRHADLFLDTLIYNAHTTTADSLWTGLPVLTLMGEEFAARVSASLLKAADLPELITHNINDFIEEAVSYAMNPKKFNQLKTRLQKSISVAPLFDTASHARHLEKAYQQVWQNYINGMPPTSFHLAVD